MSRRRVRVALCVTVAVAFVATESNKCSGDGCCFCRELLCWAFSDFHPATGIRLAHTGARRDRRVWLAYVPSSTPELRSQMRIARPNEIAATRQPLDVKRSLCGRGPTLRGRCPCVGLWLNRASWYGIDTPRRGGETYIGRATISGGRADPYCPRDEPMEHRTSVGARSRRRIGRRWSGSGLRAEVDVALRQ